VLRRLCVSACWVVAFAVATVGLVAAASGAGVTRKSAAVRRGEAGPRVGIGLVPVEVLTVLVWGFAGWRSRPGGAAVPSGGAPSMGRSTDQEDLLFERRQYRKFNAQQKTELVLAALKGHKSIAELARERDISEPLLRRWREQFLAGGAEKLLGKTERTQLEELRQRNARLERALGRKTMELEVSGELLRGWE